MGYDILSMNATSLPKVKKALRNVSLQEARELLAEVTLLELPQEIHQRMERFLTEHGMEQFIHNPVV